ncbi:MAG: hypothetical protein P1P65_08505 [Treponema sp.]
MSEQKPLSYTFSDSELKALAFVFRHITALPDCLYAFSSFAENYVYEKMTIDEAERFYAGQ